MTIEPYDTADFLKTAKAQAAYMEAAFAENDPDFFQSATRTVARAKERTDRTIVDESVAMIGPIVTTEN